MLETSQWFRKVDPSEVPPNTRRAAEWMLAAVQAGLSPQRIIRWCVLADESSAAAELATRSVDLELHAFPPAHFTLESFGYTEHEISVEATQAPEQAALHVAIIARSIWQREKIQDLYRSNPLFVPERDLQEYTERLLTFLPADGDLAMGERLIAAGDIADPVALAERVGAEVGLDLHASVSRVRDLQERQVVHIRVPMARNTQDPADPPRDATSRYELGPAMAI
ncbi:MAG TPA: hypothetical protein VNH18_08975 [Bryobacteraceae bacterium]|nr:hypothetical protein [Bryobacteraceae bacterium]